MKEKEIFLTKALKIILIVFCLIGGLYIGFMKVPNQGLTLKISSDEGRFSVNYSADAINAFDDTLYIDWTTIGAKELKEIEIYRYFKSIVIAKITGDSFWQYGSFDESGIYLNQDGVNLLVKESKSFLMERMIYVEILLAIILFLWILVNALKEKIDPNNRDNHGPIYEISMFIKNVGNYREYMIFAAKADLKAEVANSYLNRLWWVLEPFCNMIVYVIVFGKVMGNGIERYATFVFSALVMWNFFNHIINYSVKAVRFNRDIVTKIYVPKYILLMTNMVLNFIKLLFSLLVLIVMLIIFRNPVSWTFIWIIPTYILMILLAFGMGMVFLHYGVFIDDLAYAVGIMLTLIMFLSGIFYDVTVSLPEPLNHILMCVNPVAIFVDTMRNALLYQEISNVPLMIIWIILSLLIGYIGVHIVNKNENGYVKVI